MSEKLYCTVTSELQANNILIEIERAGFQPDELVIANDASAIEMLSHPPLDLARTTKWGIGLGAFVGWLVGVIFLLLGGYPEFISWIGAPLIPFGAALGWAFYGAILGGSGMFTKAGVAPALERHFDNEIAAGKMIIAIPLHDRTELDKLAATLYAAGATDVHYSKGIAA